VYHLNLGEQAMLDQPHRNYPILGFVAGTPLLTSSGHKPIEQVQPDDFIQTRPDDQGDGGPEDVHDGDGDCDCPDHDPRWWEKN
jgi:hypothetical protein